MRHQVAQWLLEVCESEECSPPCYPQAIQLLDRFLSKQSVPTTQLQLLATTCLFIASKGNFFGQKFHFWVQSGTYNPA
mgnify:CR=1 FL=1